MEGYTEWTPEDRGPSGLSGPSGESLLCPGGVWEEREEADREAFVFMWRDRQCRFLRMRGFHRKYGEGVETFQVICCSVRLENWCGNMGMANKARRKGETSCLVPWALIFDFSLRTDAIFSFLTPSSENTSTALKRAWLRGASPNPCNQLLVTAYSRFR